MLGIWPFCDALIGGAFDGVFPHVTIFFFVKVKFPVRGWDRRSWSYLIHKELSFEKHIFQAMLGSLEKLNVKIIYHVRCNIE